MVEDISQQSSAITAEIGEQAALSSVEGLLDREGAPRLVGADGAMVPLPDSLRRALQQVIFHLAQGQSVRVVATDDEMTTQEAADMLQVSRPYVVKLLEAGEIPFVKTGTHRRIRVRDLMAYKQRRDVGRRQALARLTQMSEELGLYDAER